MQNSLLTTKLFFPPVRPVLVHRLRLVERLQAGLLGPLTLLSAPAGSGKTTLLSEWRAGPGTRYPVGWISLSTDDNDLARFLQYLVTALDNLHRGIAKEIQPLLQTSETPQPDAILTLVINSLGDLEHESVLVFDDYHLIELPAIQHALTFLLDNLPPRLHLVLLTRSDPPLPLARLRARSHLTEIRADHLRFSVEECAQFLNQVMGLNLSGEQVAALEKRTEGWIAGLQLAALSMQGREDVDGFVSAFTGSNHFIVDYLAEEVLNRQPETVREFLLKTSILERLTGPLCDALTGRADGQETLERLAHANLFLIPLDDDQHWFRYHHIFADLLHSRLLHAHPQIARELHFRASEWFETNGFQDEGLDHAFEAKDYRRASRLLCRNDLDMMYTCPVSTLGRWLKSFPEDFLTTDPRLCIAKAHWLHASGKESELAPFIQAAQKILDAGIVAGGFSGSDINFKHIQGDVYTFQALEAIRRNDTPAALEFVQKAVEIIPETKRSRVFALGGFYISNLLAGNIQAAIQACFEAISLARKLDYPSMHATAVHTLAQALRIQGRLSQAAQVIREALEYIEQKGQARLFYNGFLHVSLAQVLYEWNALDEMETELEAGLKLCMQGGMNILCLIGMNARVQLMHARNEMEGTLKTLDEIDRECRQMDANLYLDDCKFQRAFLQAEQGDPSRLAAWVNQVDLRVGSKVGSIQFDSLFLATRSLVLLNRSDEALPVLEKVEAFARDQDLHGWRIFTLVLEAAAWMQKNSESRALDCLKQALVLAEPEGYVRIFLNLGSPMQELLRTLQRRGGDSPFVARLLASFAPPSAGKPSHTARPEILSKREVELVGLIAAGRSNKEIANELVISIGTVKRHTVNIFNKLDVKNRTEAVAKARELGLI